MTERNILNLRVSRNALERILRAKVLGADYDPLTDCFVIGIEAQRFPPSPAEAMADQTTLEMEETPLGPVIKGLTFDIANRPEFKPTGAELSDRRFLEAKRNTKGQP